MNVIFHVSTAICIAILLTDTEKISKGSGRKTALLTAVFTFVLSLISHGALDYIPHCYPVNSKLDAVLGLTVIIAFTWLANKSYRLIICASSFGSILPDVIDLAPAILNKYLTLHIPTRAKLFPWHQANFSGSVYTGNCNISTLNHTLLMLTIVAICWSRRKDAVKMFFKPYYG